MRSSLPGYLVHNGRGDGAMNKCTSIFGHKFQARYNEEFQESSLNELMKRATQISSPFLREMRSKIYIQDICARCGEIVRKP